MHGTLQQRFNAYVDRSGSCHLWTGTLDAHGYGTIGRGGRAAGLVKAHRAALELAGIDIPRGLDVCHKCGVRRCVNIEHLYIGTRKENMADMVVAGTRKGEKHAGARFTEEHVLMIRSLSAHGWTYKKIAGVFKTGISTISSIVNYYTWKHV